MNKERYNQIVDEVYVNYIKETDKLDLWKIENSHLVEVTGPIYNASPRQFTKEEFIDKIKTDKEFSEMWGLKIEERGLSDQERIILMNKKLGVTDTLPQYYNTDDEMNKSNIPTKLITVTYNNETIEIYE